MSLLQIFEGWRNHLVPPEELKSIIELAQKERLSICDLCEYNSKNLRQSDTPTCVSCGCILIAKTACLTCKCPKEKWSNIDVKPTEENEKPETNNN
jgi:hypothetical protein